MPGRSCCRRCSAGTFYTSATVMVVTTGIYTVFGGLAAVIYTELLQAVVLLLGAATLTHHRARARSGGMAGLRAALPPDYFHMIKPSSDAAFPWTGIFFGAPILGIWYWCTDQMIVQRVLGAKNEAHARGGALLCGLLKILPVFVLVLPGPHRPRALPRHQRRRGVSDAGHPAAADRPRRVHGRGADGGADVVARGHVQLGVDARDLRRLQGAQPGATEKQLVGVGRIVTVVMVGLSMAVGAVHQVPELRGVHLPPERAGVHQPADRRGLPGRRVLAARQPFRRDRLARRRRRARRRPVPLRAEPRQRARLGLVRS